MMDAQHLRDLMKRMQAEDPHFRVFGSRMHKYQIGSPLIESELQAFEQQHHIRLPDDYRRFLKEVGNGGTTRSNTPIISINAGAGPYFGIQPLDEAVLGCDLSRPFPLTESSESQSIEGIERWGNEEAYPGILEICYQGSANFAYLVVNGPAYGTVWDLHWHFYPTGLTFGAWYRRWTDWLVEEALPILAHEREEGKKTIYFLQTLEGLDKYMP